MTGEVFTNDAEAVIQNGEWIVTVGLQSGAEGEDLWNALAAQCYNGAPTCPPQPGSTSGHGQLAIELDGLVISAPEVNAPSFDGEVSITGNFTESEAKDLAKILKFGAVPVQMEPQTVETVSATLGKDSLRAAIVAGLLGAAARRDLHGLLLQVVRPDHRRRPRPVRGDPVEHHLDPLQDPGPGAHARRHRRHHRVDRHHGRLVRRAVRAGQGRVAPRPLAAGRDDSADSPPGGARRSPPTSCRCSARPCSGT